MHARNSFDYAIIRVVPRVERGECINVGVILFCRTRRFLGALIELDVPRLLALAPYGDVALIEQHLATIPRICAGEQKLGTSVNFRNLSVSTGSSRRAAPSSRPHRLIPVSAPILLRLLEHLMETMVRLSPPSAHEHSL